MGYIYQGSTQRWVHDNQSGMQHGVCPLCGNVVVSSCKYENAPPIISINIGQQKIPIDTKVTLDTTDGQTHRYNVCGVVYLGGFHFVSRIIDKANNVWYYDGMHEATSMGVKEGKLKATNRHNLLQVRENRTASLVLYTLDESFRIDSE